MMLQTVSSWESIHQQKMGDSAILETRLAGL